MNSWQAVIYWVTLIRHIHRFFSWHLITVAFYKLAQSHKWPTVQRRFCAWHRSGTLPGTWGKWGQRGGKGDEGGPGPPKGEGDKQALLNEGRDKMEKDKEERASRTWWRRISANTVSHFSSRKDYVKCEHYWIELTFCLFQENKSYGVKTICIDHLSTRCCTSCL